jgi:hypothetical protein
MDRPVNPDSLEPKVVLAGSIRQKGRSNTGIGRDSGGRDTDPEEEEGDTIDPDIGIV